MSRRSRLVPILLLTLSASVLPLHAAESGAASVESAWLKAFKANDVNGVVALYAPDAVGYFPGMAAVSGENGIRAAFEGMMSGNNVQDAKFFDRHSKTSGNVSVGWGRFELTLVPKAGGAPIVMKGRFTDVVERRNGKWLYIVDHASDEPPPAPAPAK